MRSVVGRFCRRDEHDHDHPPTAFHPDLKQPSEDWEFLEIALREILIEEGVGTAREISDRT